MWPTAGPFLSNDEYLLVAEYHKMNVYQLKPDSGEVRAVPMKPCQPVSIAFDPAVNVLYMTCVELINNSGDKYQYRIRKKTFDGKIDQAIFNAPSSTFAKNICNVLYFIKN